MKPIPVRVGDDKNPSNNATFISVFFLGISTIAGTQVSFWNEGLSHGFWPLFGSQLFMLSGYICLALCLCEMTAALPFSGGTFGLTRVTLGLIPGYFFGAFEMMEYIVYVALTVFSLGGLMSEATGINRKYEPIYWVLFYVSGFIIQLYRQNLMWLCFILFGAFILLYMSVFVVAVPSAVHANFQNFAVNHNYSEPTSSFLFNCFKCMPHTSWLFVGIETLPMTSGDLIQPNKTIPRAIRALMITLIITSISVVFVSSSVSPGAISTEFQSSHSPLSYGYSAMLGISYNQATIFTIIIKYITGFGFMFAYGRQISAMQRSGLVMNSFTAVLGEKNSIQRGYLLGIVFGMLVLSFTWKFNPAYFKHIHSAMLLGNYLVCLGVCCSYIPFRHKYSSLAKNFRSVLGISGAVYGMLVFIVAFVSLAGFNDDEGMGVFTLSWFVGYMSIRYIIYNFGRPIISQEEQSVLFVLYVINANTARKKHIAELTLARVARENYCQRIVLDSSSDDRMSVDSTVSGTRQRMSTPLRQTINRYFGISLFRSSSDRTADDYIAKRHSNLLTDDSFSNDRQASEAITLQSEEISRRILQSQKVTLLQESQDADKLQLQDVLGDNDDEQQFIRSDFENVEQSQTIVPVPLRRSFTSPKITHADIEESPGKRLSGSKKFSETFGSVKLGSQKFSSSEGSAKRLAQIDRTTDLTTIAGFAAQRASSPVGSPIMNGRGRSSKHVTSDSITVSQEMPQIPSTGVCKTNTDELICIEGDEDLNRHLNELGSNSNSSRKKPQIVTRKGQIMPIDEVKSEDVSMTTLPAGLICEDNSLNVISSIVTSDRNKYAFFKSTDTRNNTSHAALISHVSNVSSSDDNSSREVDDDFSAIPDLTTAKPTNRGRFRSPFNFRYFSNGNHKPPINAKRNIAAISQIAKTINNEKYVQGDSAKMDSSIMDMYSDEVEEFFSHHSEDWDEGDV